jgi:hypothetical protein
MKAFVEADVWVHIFLRRVVCFTLLPLYSRGQSLLLSIEGCVGPTDYLDDMEKCTFLTLSGFE